MYFRAQASAMTLETRESDLVFDRWLLGDASFLTGFGDELHIDELSQKLTALLSRHFPTGLPRDVGDVLFELRFRDVPAVDRWRSLQGTPRPARRPCRKRRRAGASTQRTRPGSVGDSWIPHAGELGSTNGRINASGLRPETDRQRRGQRRGCERGEARCTRTAEPALFEQRCPTLAARPCRRIGERTDPVSRPPERERLRAKRPG